MFFCLPMAEHRNIVFLLGLNKCVLTVINVLPQNGQAVHKKLDLGHISQYQLSYSSVGLIRTSTLLAQSLKMFVILATI